MKIEYNSFDYTYAISIEAPSFNQEICGRGFPTAAQSSVVTDPSKAIVEWGLATNSGAFNFLILSAKFHMYVQIQFHLNIWLS